MGWWEKFIGTERESEGVSSVALPPEPSGAVDVKLLPEEPPEFQRVYTVRLDNRAAMKIEIKRWTLGMIKHGELRQPNGNVVWFEPDRIADKILDPLLVPIIQKYVDEIYALDRAFRGSNQPTFIDKTGVRWRSAA